MKLGYMITIHPNSCYSYYLWQEPAISSYLLAPNKKNNSPVPPLITTTNSSCFSSSQQSNLTLYQKHPSLRPYPGWQQQSQQKTST